MAASTPPRSIFLYSLIIFFFSLISSSATTASFAETNNNNIKKGDTDSSLGYDSFPKTQAQKLIRAFNLFPEHEVNQYDHDAITDTKHDFIGSSSRIVEKKFKFPFIEKSAAGGSVKDDLAHHAGYYHLNHSKSARMFYLFFESRNISTKKDPVVIWLTGGPGCSSELALFYENGPFHITNNLNLTLNDYGWDKVSNLLYVDQPTGTGFSYTSDDADIRHNEKGVSNDLYDFLQAFFKEHSDYIKNDFYITGESYAGHYIPALASRINQGNKNKEGLPINLKGFAIGNGLTNPEIQYGAYADYAVNMSLIKQSDYNTTQLSECQNAIKLCGAHGGSNCTVAFDLCNRFFNKIVHLSGSQINYYDIRKKCVGDLCYDFSNMEKFLKQQYVKDALGVRDIEFVSCSPTVYEAMKTDWMRNLEVGIPALLKDGIKLLVYAGEYDLICNWLGNSRWVDAMEWHGRKKFVAAQPIPFRVGHVMAGSGKGYGPLTFLKIKDAGHMVPMDQPKVSLHMLSRWMHDKLGFDTLSR